MVNRCKAYLLLFLIIVIRYSFSCTTFAINDDPSYVYLAKNRDMFPDRQAVVVFVPQESNALSTPSSESKKYKFIALVSKAQTYKEISIPNTWVVRFGVNEANLAINNMFAADPFIARHEIGDRYDDGDDFMRYVLTNYNSVNSVINAMPFLASKFSYPEFYTLADKKEIAYIEIGKNGDYKIKFTLNGHLTHTNNYLVFKDKDYNNFFTESSSSILRLKQVSQLIDNMHGTYSESSLLNVLNDQAFGDNDSILRLGNPVSNPQSARTLASLLIKIPKSNKAENTLILIKLLNLNEEYKFILNEDFWRRFEEDTVVSLN